MRAVPKSALEEMSQAAFFQQIGGICSAVNAITNTKDLLEITLQKTLDLFGAKRGSIFILDDNGKDLILKIASGMRASETDKMIKRIGEGIVGQVAQIKKPLFVDDISTDKRFKDFKQRGSYKTPSFLCAPLLIKDKLIGVINIADKSSGLRFDEQELQLLDFLSSQIALNYRRVQLYKKFKEVVKETRTLKDRLGQSDQEAAHLKRQMHIQEKLATIGKLAGGIAHEFNNPLDGVMRYTNLCLEHIKDDDVVRGYLLEIKHGLNRMANIVRNLLACSRSETFRKDKIDFSTVLDFTLTNLHGEIMAKNILVTRRLQKGLPQLRDLGLERILTNLIRNAVDAMEDGGRLAISARFEHGYVVFKIKDTGSGISKEIIEKIFEPFFTTKDMEKGCGLGLTIVSEIIKSYEGNIDVESSPRKGTTFTVELPVDGGL